MQVNLIYGNSISYWSNNSNWFGQSNIINESTQTFDIPRRNKFYFDIEGYKSLSSLSFTLEYKIQPLDYDISNYFNVIYITNNTDSVNDTFTIYLSSQDSNYNTNYLYLDNNSFINMGNNAQRLKQQGGTTIISDKNFLLFRPSDNLYSNWSDKGHYSNLEQTTFNFNFSPKLTTTNKFRIYVAGPIITNRTINYLNEEILSAAALELANPNFIDINTIEGEPFFTPNKEIFNTNYTLGEFIKSGKGNNNAYFQGLEARYQTYNNNKILTTADIITPTYINNEGKVTTAAYETLNNIHNLANNIAYSSAYTVPSNLSSKNNYITTTARSIAWDKVKNTALEQYDKIPDLDPYYVVINLLGYNEKY